MAPNSAKECCFEHSGHQARLDAHDNDIQENWKSIDAAHRRIDGMKNWVIAGMTSLVIQLVLMILGLVMVYAKMKGA